MSFKLILCATLVAVVNCAPRPKAHDLSPAESIDYAYGRHYDYGRSYLPYGYQGHGYAHKYGHHHKGYDHHSHGKTFRSNLLTARARVVST